MNRAKWIFVAIAGCAGIAFALAPTASADGGIDCARAKKWNSGDSYGKGTVIVYESAEFRCKAEKCAGQNPAVSGDVWERVGDCKSGTAPN